MSTQQSDRTLEDRLRAVEDTLAVYHLIASHPPAADSGTEGYYREAFMADGVIDLGGGKTANGNDAIAAVVSTPEHQAAIAGGLCHFTGLPRVDLDGDRPTATSYLQIITPHKGAAAMEVAGHGSSTGFRIHRVGANRWELERTADGWKVTRRTLRPLDGNDEARALLRRNSRQKKPRRHRRGTSAHETLQAAEGMALARVRGHVVRFREHLHQQRQSCGKPREAWNGRHMD